ncbi:unnamed protein product, partial [Prorocentrum cordatum]
FTLVLLHLLLRSSYLGCPPRPGEWPRWPRRCRHADHSPPRQRRRSLASAPTRSAAWARSSTGGASTSSTAGRRSWIRAPTASSSRFVLLVARGLADGLVQLGEVGWLRTCQASGCGHCSAEIAEGFGDQESDVERRFAQLTSRLLRFAELFEGACTRSEGGPGKGTPRLLQWRGRVASMSAQVRGIAEAGGAVGSLRDLLSAARVAEGGPASEGFLRVAAGFRRAFGQLHGAVVVALDALPALAVAGRFQGGPASALLGHSGFVAYLRDSLEGADDTAQSWPRVVELAQGRARPVRPFSRTSAICDADRERLFDHQGLPTAIGNRGPYRDSSGAQSWHGAPAHALLEALRLSGTPPAFEFWSVYPPEMNQHHAPCADAHGAHYDPTACLEQSGLEGHVHYVSQRTVAQDRGGGRTEGLGQPSSLSLQAAAFHTPRLWAGQRADAAPESEAMVSQEAWPPELPDSPVDVLYLHPGTGNCALLRDLIQPQASAFRFVYAPINPIVPPPLRVLPDFAHFMARELEEERVEVELSRVFLAQCSLAQVVAILAPRGFALLHVEHLYAVFALEELAAALRGRDPHPADAGQQHGDPQPEWTFEAWRLGWFCSPLSRLTLWLEEQSHFSPSWLDVGGLRPSEAQAATAASVACGLLARQGMRPDATAESACPPGHSAQPGPSEAPPSVRLRMQWALETRGPLSGVAYHLERGAGKKAASWPAGGASGTCVDGACECLVPWRGPRCDVEDSGAGPVFNHPAVTRLDYLWSLDTDSHLPQVLHEDPFEVMHKNESLVLGYQYLTQSSPISAVGLWESTLLYMGYNGVDIVGVAQDKQAFLKRFLMTPQGWKEAPSWNDKVVMTDCELLRVRFFGAGTEYFRYFSFLDSLGGFWKHRWGDHAVRGLGTGIAIWLAESGPAGASGSCLGTCGARPWRPSAYEMAIPYAHQRSCFCRGPLPRCTALGPSASGEAAWPAKKAIWECGPASAAERESKRERGRGIRKAGARWSSGSHARLSTGPSRDLAVPFSWGVFAAGAHGNAQTGSRPLPPPGQPESPNLESYVSPKGKRESERERETKREREREQGPHDPGTAEQGLNIAAGVIGQ